MQLDVFLQKRMSNEITILLQEFVKQQPHRSNTYSSFRKIKEWVTYIKVRFWCKTMKFTLFLIRKPEALLDISFYRCWIDWGLFLAFSLIEMNEDCVSYNSLIIIIYACFFLCHFLHRILILLSITLLVASVDNNPNLIEPSNVNVNNDINPCQVGSCKKRRKVLVPVLASVIPSLVLLTIAVFVLWKLSQRRNQRGNIAIITSVFYIFH